VLRKVARKKEVLLGYKAKFICGNLQGRVKDQKRENQRDIEIILVISNYQGRS
jgi:hypothetical protein